MNALRGLRRTATLPDPMRYPVLAFATPRKLPSTRELDGRVVVLDLAFAADGTGTSFEKVTKRFIDGLGSRLALWVDHHDHELHAEYKKDPRFILATKQEHGACPEMITAELVERAGMIDTVVCHGDFDGLASAAKWIRGGTEPYPGADADARAIDTRIGKPGELALTVDRALRARPKDDALKGLVVRFLAEGGTDRGLLAEIRTAASAMQRLEEAAELLAKRYEVHGDVAICDARNANVYYDKTELLLLGQERAKIALVHDESTVTLAAAFDSGIDFLRLLDLGGGMPTRVSVPAARLRDVLERLGLPPNA